MNSSRKLSARLAAIFLGLGLIVSSADPSGAAGSTTTSPATGSSTTTSATSTSTSTTSTSTTTTVHSPPLAPRNPWTYGPIASFLRTRTDDLTGGIYDLRTRRTYLYRPSHPEVTASMVKIDILADLLYEAQRARRSLSPAELALATSMIEYSDNNAAQKLWNDIGGFGLSSRLSGTGGYYAISSFNHLLGFTQTITNWGWGLMRTTPADYLKLLRAITEPNSILDPSSRALINSLMYRVTPSQRFGLGDLPSEVKVELKNGWYPEPTGWQVNTCGLTSYRSTDYLAVIMTAQNPDETYAISTVNDLAGLLFTYEQHHS